MKSRHSVILRTQTFIFTPDYSHILLQLGLPTKTHFANIFNAPGGHVEKGENIQTSAIREITEETGINIHPDKMYLAGLMHIHDYHQQYILNCLFRTIMPITVQLSHNEGHHEWISLEQIKTLVNIAPDLPQIIPTITQLKPPSQLYGTCMWRPDRSVEKLEVTIT